MQADNFLNEQLDNMDNNLGTNIKIRSLDGEFQVKINIENKVEELKRKIEDISKVPTNRQRLIYRGKLLKDSDALSFYKISDLDVIHLVAKTAEQRAEEESEMNNESNNTTRRNENSSMFNLMNRMFRLDNSDSGNEANGTLGGNTRPAFIPAIVGRRSRRHGIREENINFNTFESKEAIVQNFEYLNNLRESSQIQNSENIRSNEDNKLSNNFVNMNISEENKIEKNNLIPNFNNFNTLPPNKDKEHKNNIDESTIKTTINKELLDTDKSNKYELFDFTKIKLKKGQWVDVKDTIDQWLEAQVIDVKDDKAYIHYNGWGTRWDEWIEMKSDRIRPFRYHTRQTSFTNYQSPYPNIKPDANINMTSNPTDTESVFDTFDNIKSAFNMADSIMNEIKKTRQDTSNIENIHTKQKEIYLLSKNLAPILDRLGRTITDVGVYINFNLRNNKLEDLDKKIFDMNNLDPSLKCLEHTDQQRVEEEQAAIRNNRDSGAHIISPVNQLDRMITNQIPIIDTPLTIHNSRPNQTQPAVDIYVHTIITPLTNSNSQQNSTNTTNTRSQQGSNPSEGSFNSPLDFINLLTNSRHSVNNTSQTSNENNTQRATPNANTDFNNNINISSTLQNNNDNNFLGHKREAADSNDQENERNNSDINKNTINMPADTASNNFQNNSNVNVAASGDLQVSDDVNHSSPCFDIIVEDYVEAESIEEDDVEDEEESNVGL